MSDTATAPEAVEQYTDGNGRPQPILTAMRKLGPCTAAEIADDLGRDAGNVSTQLRNYENRGVVRRTGRAVNPPGRSARGGPQIEWELMPVNGSAEPTSPSTAIQAPPGPVEDRLRAMAERVGRANGRIEALEAELDDAKARAEQAEERARAAEDRRQDAERRAAAAVANVEGGGIDAKQLEERVAAITQEREALAAELEQLRRAPAAAGDQEMRGRYFDLLLGMAEREGADEHVFDRLERLINGTHGQE